MNYEIHKSSENDWVGEIPSHWSIIKLKYAALVQPSNVDKKQNDGEAQVLLCNYVDVYKNEFIDETIKFMEASASENEIQKFKIQKGDVLITKDSETPDDIAIPAYVSKDLGNVLCGYHLALLRSQKDILKGFYLYYLLKSYRFNQQFTIAANGITRFGLSIDDVRNAIISLPSTAEQTQIAVFLDHKTRLIDDLIIKKQKLIELLKEERTAFINQAVTKGLDPTVSMKDSGIEWLGNIPEHWSIRKLKYSISIKSGDGIANIEVNPEHLIPIYGGNGIMGYTDSANSDTLELIIGRVGALCGNVYMVGGQKWISDNALRLTTIDNYEFMYYFLQSMNLNDLATKTAQPLITGSLVKNQYSALPPINEQQSIVDYIKLKNNQLSDTISTLKNEIQLMSEYKTSLINEAVTGKIDVRDYQITHA